MKIGNIFAMSIVLLCLLFIPQVLAKENIDVSATNNLNSELQKAVNNYNQVIENKASSWNDVIKCTDQIDLIKSKINVTVKSLFPDNFITFFYPLIYRFVRS